MSNANDFVIENGILMKYTGDDTDIVIPEEVTEINAYAFYFNRNHEMITSIVIPDSVTKINDHAFIGCRSLSSIDIPDTVEKIGNEAFFGCRSLSSIYIPAGVSELDGSVFSGLKKLSNITIDGNNNYFSIDKNGILFNKDKTILIKFPADNSITKYTIPDSVKTIGDYAFEYCENIMEITIPDDVTTIGKHAFFSCTHLDTITIPDGVTQIAEETFAFCEDLRVVNFSNSITKIESEAFTHCTKLESINLPDSVEYVWRGAFSDLYPFATFSMCHKVAQALKNGCFRTIVDDPGNPYPFFLNVKINDEAKACIFLVSKNDDEKTDLFLNKNKINMRDYDKFVAQDKRYKTEYKLYAALTRLANPYKLDKAVAKYYKELLESNLKKAVTIACDNRKTEWLKVMLEHKIINKENYKKISSVIKSTCDGVTDLFATIEDSD